MPDGIWRSNVYRIFYLGVLLKFGGVLNYKILPMQNLFLKIFKFEIIE